MVPEFAGYPSRALPGGGRAYRIVGETHCAAYPVADPAALRRAGVRQPYFAFAFYEPDGVGTWHAALHATDIRRFMDLYRITHGRPVTETLPPRFAPAPPDPPPMFALARPA